MKDFEFERLSEEYLKKIKEQKKCSYCEVILKKFDCNSICDVMKDKNTDAK